MQWLLMYVIYLKQKVCGIVLFICDSCFRRVTGATVVSSSIANNLSGSVVGPNIATAESDIVVRCERTRFNACNFLTQYHPLGRLRNRACSPRWNKAYLPCWYAVPPSSWPQNTQWPKDGTNQHNELAEVSIENH